MQTTEKISTIQEIQISYRAVPEIIKKEAVTSSSSAYKYIKTVFNEESVGLREQFNALLLNKANKPLGFIQLSNGGLDATVVDVRLLMATTLKALATGIILCHNHPSGSLKPSQADLKITNKIKEACQYFDIHLLDHIIVNPVGEYSSMADEGIL